MAGAVTIAVTGEEESDLAKGADYVFMTPVRHTSEVSQWISSRISQIAFVDALCAAILDSDREKFGKCSQNPQVNSRKILFIEKAEFVKADIIRKIN